MQNFNTRAPRGRFRRRKQRKTPPNLGESRESRVGNPHALPRSLDALTLVSDPTGKVAELNRLTRRKRSAGGRNAKAFNPLARESLQLFHVLADGADSAQEISQPQPALLPRPRRGGRIPPLAPPANHAPRTAHDGDCYSGGKLNFPQPLALAP